MSGAKRALRRFNDAGLHAFSLWLIQRDGSNPPLGMLDDEALTGPLGAGDGVEIEIKPFARKYDLGVHILAALGPKWEQALDDSGLLAWLSLAFYQSTMVNAAGKPYLGQPSRHLVAVDNQWKSYTHSHRHLVRSAGFFTGHFGEAARVFLAGHPSEHSKIEEQIGSRKTEGLPFSKPVAEALNALYYDPATGKIRRGAAGNRGGGIERFVRVIRQLDLTFDVQSQNAEALLKLMPNEFARFAPKASGTGPLIDKES
jgi:hypothetical protein